MDLNQNTSNVDAINASGEVSNVKWTKITESTTAQCIKPKPRQCHRAVVYGNFMIVFGGAHGPDITNDLHVFDTQTHEWFQPKTRGEIPQGHAAYGLVIYGHRMIMHGGTSHAAFGSDLYQLDILNWEWKKLELKGPDGKEPPRGRLGHSFALVKNRIYIFGGMGYDGGEVKKYCSRYLNDLYTLQVGSNNENVLWDIPPTYGSPPGPREGHTAVAHVSKDKMYHKLIIYGGMFNERLGDLYTFDVDTLMWWKPAMFGAIPKPRSLHTATMVGDKMYVFGGWVPNANEELVNSEGKWTSTNSMACFNLENFSWENLLQASLDEDKMPRARAGHCAVLINSRIYVWGGSYDRKKVLFCEDLWQLELGVPKPASPQTRTHVRLNFVSQLTTADKSDDFFSATNPGEPGSGNQLYTVLTPNYYMNQVPRYVLGNRSVRGKRYVTATRHVPASSVLGSHLWEKPPGSDMSTVNRPNIIARGQSLKGLGGQGPRPTQINSESCLKIPLRQDQMEAANSSKTTIGPASSKVDQYVTPTGNVVTVPQSILNTASQQQISLGGKQVTLLKHGSTTLVKLDSLSGKLVHLTENPREVGKAKSFKVSPLPASNPLMRGQCGVSGSVVLQPTITLCEAPGADQHNGVNSARGRGGVSGNKVVQPTSTITLGEVTGADQQNGVNSARGRGGPKGRARVESRVRGRVESRGRGRVESRGRGRVGSRGSGRVEPRGRARGGLRGKGASGEPLQTNASSSGVPQKKRPRKKKEPELIVLE